MDKRMTKLEEEIKNVRKQNKQLLETLERHINEKADLRKEIYKKYANPSNPTFKEGTD
jgi:hypothetical protein|tara:strand:- start:1442 stop:1615 length:174 start_codon:yes stop_codon:yes gene_type:complete